MVNYILFYQYGRSVSSGLEYETFTGLQSIYEQVIDGSLPGRYSHLLQGGIISFFMALRGENTMTADQIARIIVEMQVLYLNNLNGPREILRAEVRPGYARTDVAVFQILFSRVA